MESKEIVREEQTGLGSIRISDEVVKVIAGLAAIDINGVAGMSGGIAGGIAEMLGRKNLSRGSRLRLAKRKLQ